MTRNSATVFAFLLGALAPSLAAQSAGVLTGTPATVFVGPGTSGPAGALGANQVHRKKAGFLPLGGNAPVDQPGDPVFTTSAMFNGGLGPPSFDVDALSLGLDVVTAAKPSAGVAMVDFVGAGGGWGALGYSVSTDTNGEPGSLVEQEKLSPGGAAADLFTLMVYGSDIPPAVLAKYPIDVPQRALDSLEMDIVDSPASDITSVDLTMQLYQAGTPAKPSDPSPVLFFSVSHDSIFPPGGGSSAVPPSWFDCGNPSGATILKTRWMPNLAEPMGGHWTAPRVHLSYEHLGLDLHDDIDALAVDRAQGLVLFSIVATLTSTLDEQLQVASWPLGTLTCAGMTGNVDVGIFSEPSTLPGDFGAVAVANRMGLESTADIDSVCEEDPGSQSGGFPLAFGAPVGPGGIHNDLNIGVFRDDDDPLGPTITLTVANLPASGPGKVLEAYLLAPIFLPVLSFPLDALAGATTFEASLAHPVLGGGTSIGSSASFIWVLRQPGVPGSKITSPVMAIDI